MKPPADQLPGIIQTTSAAPSRAAGGDQIITTPTAIGSAEPYSQMRRRPSRERVRSDR